MCENEEILFYCHQLANKLPCDFVGLAMYDKSESHIRWKYAIGSRNMKYKRIIVRYGKGIVGQVIQTGSPIILSSFPQDAVGKDVDYPIMLAERLVSCVAVPICYEQIPQGVLLVGNRTKHLFSKDQQHIIWQITHQLENILLKTYTR